MKYKYYKAYMACRDGKTRTVTITTDATDNTSTKMLTLTGCTLEMDSDEDVFTPVRVTRGKLSVQCNDSDISIEDLLPSKLKSHTITIIRNDGVVELNGYLTAQSASQSFPAQGNDFDLQFVSRLGIAESVPFWPINQTIRGFSRVTILDTIDYCLKAVGYDDQTTSKVILPLYPISSAQEYTIDYISKAGVSMYPFAHYEKSDDYENFRGQHSVKDVLEMIARYYCFSMYENNNNVICLSPDSEVQYTSYVIDIQDTAWNISPNFTSEQFTIYDCSDITFQTDSVINYINPCKTVTIQEQKEVIDNPFSLKEDVLIENECHHGTRIDPEYIFQSYVGIEGPYPEGETTTSVDESAKAHGFIRYVEPDFGVVGWYSTVGFVKYISKLAGPTPTLPSNDVGVMVSTTTADGTGLWKILTFNAPFYFYDKPEFARFEFKSHKPSQFPLVGEPDMYISIDGNANIKMDFDEENRIYYKQLNNVPLCNSVDIYMDKRGYDEVLFLHDFNSEYGRELNYNSLPIVENKEGREKTFHYESNGNDYTFELPFAAEYPSGTNNNNYDRALANNNITLTQPISFHRDHAPWSPEWFDVVAQRVCKQKNFKRHQLEIGTSISEVVGSGIPMQLEMNSSTYLLTGFSRDYMEGIDKIKITSIQ